MNCPRNTRNTPEYAPEYAQSLNRYSYTLNNPLNATDPSGYFFKKIIGIVVAVVGTVICGPQCGYLGFALIGATAGAVSAAVNGGNILKGAVIGALSAVAFNAIGEYFAGIESANAAGWNVDYLKDVFGGEFSIPLTGAQTIAKVAAHGLAGGAMSALNGGKFGHGFASAGLTQAFAGRIGNLNKANKGFSPARTLAAAVVGGTVSKITGGKFASGAVTGAFSRAFNDEQNHVSESELFGNDDLKEIVDGKAVTVGFGIWGEVDALFVGAAGKLRAILQVNLDDIQVCLVADFCGQAGPGLYVGAGAEGEAGFSDVYRPGNVQESNGTNAKLGTGPSGGIKISKEQIELNIGAGLGVTGNYQGCESRSIKCFGTVD